MSRSIHLHLKTTIRSSLHLSRFAFGLLLYSMVVPAVAAPPNIDFLFPAGAARGTTAAVIAHGTLEKWPVRVWCSRSDISIAAADEKAKLSVTVPADAPPGVCWVRFYDAGGASPLRPFVVGMLPEVIETEPNNEPAKPQLLAAADVTVNGRLERQGDVDIFAAQLRQGQTLVASLEAHQRLGSPMDGVLQVLSKDGFVLEQNDDDQGLDPRIAFEVPADGTYLVRVLAFPAEANASIALAGGANYVYRLTLTTAGFIDHVWPLAASTGGPAEAQVFGWNIPESAQRLPLVALPDSVSLTLFAPHCANDVTLPVVAHHVATENVPSGAHGPQELQVPVTLTGRIGHEREVDAYRVALRKGESLNLSVEARGLGSPLDPVLAVNDVEGKTLHRVDDTKSSRDPELTFTAPADGAYQISVADLNRRGGWRYVYRLTLAAPRPDFALSVATDAFTVVPAKPLEIPVAIDRSAGFAEEIEINAEGLPPGATAMPVRSPGTGEGAKSAKLVITAGEGPWSGGLSIKGKSSGDSKLSRQARAPIARSTARTADLWLTVLAAPASN